MKAWLKGSSIKQKLGEKEEKGDEIEDGCYLFHLLRRSLGVLTYEEMSTKKEDLKSTYNAHEFATVERCVSRAILHHTCILFKVPGLLDEQARKDITKLEFHIVYEKRETFT